MDQRVVLLPGMGGDARMHAEIASMVPGVVSAGWPDHRGYLALYRHGAGLERASQR